MKPATADDVFDLMEAYATSAALNAAMELGLFWLLAERPLASVAIAQALGIPRNRCQYWLQLLTATGLIVETPAGYATSPTAQTAILEACSQDTWAFLAGEAREGFPAVLDLALHIHKPESTWAAQGLQPPIDFAQMVESPDRARRFTRMLCEIHLPLADKLAEHLQMSHVERLLDLGGGSGVMSLALLRRHPDLKAVVVDIANVCAAGREIAAENALQERITYHAADFVRDDLPSGFDMVLECDVGVYSEEVLRKMWALLNPGGRLVIVDHFAPAEGVAPATPPYTYWAFLASLADPEFSFPTATQMQERLRQAGFQPLSVETLVVKEALRWSRDWVVIVARKQAS